MRDDVDLVESVLAKDVALLENVPPDGLGGPTLCSEYDVGALTRHMAGWLRVFAASSADRPLEGKPGEPGGEPAPVFRDAAGEIVRAWRTHGTDRTVELFGGPMPGSAVLGMMLIEYVTHGCDLALATGQDVPFADEEVEAALAHALASLQDENRRANVFAPPVTVPDDAPAVERLLGFLGRSPH